MVKEIKFELSEYELVSLLGCVMYQRADVEITLWDEDLSKIKKFKDKMSSAGYCDAVIIARWLMLGNNIEIGHNSESGLTDKAMMERLLEMAYFSNISKSVLEIMEGKYNPTNCLLLLKYCSVGFTSTDFTKINM